MGRKLHVNVSIPATRLFIGSIPKDKTKEEFEAELVENNVEKVFCYFIGVTQREYYGIRMLTLPCRR